MKFNAFILEKYGMTKEVYNSKPDWANELTDSKKDNEQLHLYIDEAYYNELISASYSKFLH